MNVVARKILFSYKFQFDQYLTQVEQNISLVQARALEQVEMDSAAEDDYSDMQDVEDVCSVTVIFSALIYKTKFFVLLILNKFPLTCKVK